MSQEPKGNTERQLAIRHKYGSPAEFMARFSPTIQRKLRELGIDYVEASRYDYPTIGELREAYGGEVVHAWMCIMVENLNDFCGVKQKMTDEQKEEVAHILMCECVRLNIAEVALFFDKVKRGVFGEYYGILDTVRTMKILKDFMRERKVAINRALEAEEKERQAMERESWRRDAMSHEELQEAIASGRFGNLKVLFGDYVESITVK